MACCTRRKRNPSIFKAILNRQIYGSTVPQDIRMIRTMIENGREFKKVFEMPSRSRIVSCLPDRLYFDSFSTCYKLTNVSTKPRILYSLPRRPLIVTSKRKVKSILPFECPLDQTTFCKVQGTFYANGPYTFALTADNYLKVIDIDSGNALEKVYLLPGRTFRYLKWETEFERLVVQSTLLPQRPTANVMQRVPTDTDHVLLYLAIFKATPLEFICMLPISFNIFGAESCSASVGNGMLIVWYRSQKLQVFSLEDILMNHTTPLKLGEYLKPGNNLCLPEMDKFTSGVVGKPPLGLPRNVTLSEKPCVLFEVPCCNDGLSLGGYPLHYVTKVNHVFHVRSVKDHALAENGMLDDDSLSLSTDIAFFHTDLSGRVLFITSTNLSCLKLCSASSNPETKTYKLCEQYKLDYRQPTKASNNIQTKSGRKVKQPLSNRDSYIEMEVIQDFDYDDELDLLVVLYLSQTTKGEGIVGFYDNQTGKCLRSLNIDGISEQGEHSVAIDRHTLVIISKYGGSFKCLVYVLL